MLNKRFTSPLAQSLLLIAAVAVSLPAASLLAALCAPLFGFSFSEVSYGVANGNLSLSRYMLAVQSVAVFLLPPLLVAMLIAPHRVGVLLGVHRKPLLINVLRSAFVMLAAVPFISLAANINAQLPMPQWAKDMEASAAQLTEQLLMVGDIKNFLLNLLVMALLPAVCEEVFFRGYVQRTIQGWTKNPHTAIFAAAIFFSAFHLQFAGFLPRFLLGAVLGYLFYWSGSLWLSIIAHFANNAIAVCAYFYVAHNNIPINAEQLDTAMQGNTLSALLSVSMAAYFMYSIFLAEKARRKIGKIGNS